MTGVLGLATGGGALADKGGNGNGKGTDKKPDCCPDSAPRLCDDVCVDFSSDPRNCGGCGHDCGSNGTCDNGVCHCTKSTCASLGLQCGTSPDGCGGTLTCGTCASGKPVRTALASRQAAALELKWNAMVPVSIPRVTVTTAAPATTSAIPAWLALAAPAGRSAATMGIHVRPTPSTPQPIPAQMIRCPTGPTARPIVSWASARVDGACVRLDRTSATTANALTFPATTTTAAPASTSADPARHAHGERAYSWLTALTVSRPPRSIQVPVQAVPATRYPAVVWVSSFAMVCAWTWTVIPTTVAAAATNAPLPMEPAHA